jgi:hypothetical protein
MPKPDAAADSTGPSNPALNPTAFRAAGQRHDVRPTGRHMAADPTPTPDSVDDEASFLVFVRALEADRRLAAREEEQDLHGYGAPRGWQNSTIEQFFASALAWADDSQFGRTQGLADDVSPWRRLAVFLYAGKMYE